jgi:plastocyanin
LLNKKDLRVINQPYIPQNAIVNVGSIVTWLNADAGHRHSITIVDNDTKNIV